MKVRETLVIGYSYLMAWLSASAMITELVYNTASDTSSYQRVVFQVKRRLFDLAFGGVDYVIKKLLGPSPGEALKEERSASRNRNTGRKDV